jgi:phospholipid/cholesterol/gamma-HCH transport system substrate-binding protein
VAAKGEENAMQKFYVEMTAGMFVVLGLVCMGYLSVRMGVIDMQQDETYDVQATFSQIGSLRPGASVVIAGVRIGQVEAVQLKDYAARVKLIIRSDIELPKDTIASICTRGLIGEQYVSLSPGAARETIESGGRIRETEPAVNLNSLIAKYAFGEAE